MSEDFNPVITEAGMAASLAAKTGGFAVDITHVAVGNTGYVIPVSDTGLATQTELSSEQQRVAIQGASEVGEGQTDISFIIDGPGDYYIREIGFFLSDGTLFAIASNATRALMWKSEISRALIGLELAFFAVDAGTLNIVSEGPPLELLMTTEIATLLLPISRLTLAGMVEKQRVSALETRIATLEALLTG